MSWLLIITAVNFVVGVLNLLNLFLLWNDVDEIGNVAHEQLLRTRRNEEQARILDEMRSARWP